MNQENTIETQVENQTPIDQNPQDSPNTSTPPTPLKQTVNKTLIIILLLSGVVIAEVGRIVSNHFDLPNKIASALNIKSGPNTYNPISSTTPEATPTPSPTSIPTTEISISSQIVWNEKPKDVDPFPLMDLKKIRSEEYSDYLPEGYSTIFSHVGTFESGQELIYAKVPTAGMGIWYTHIAIVRDGSSYKIIKNLSGLQSNISKYILPEYEYVTVSVSGLELPEKFVNSSVEYELGNLTLPENFNRMAKDWKPNFYEKSEYGDIYLSYYLIADTGVHTRTQHLEIVDGRLASLSVKAPFANDEYTPYIQIDGDEDRSGKYSNSTFRGCGGNPGVTIVKENSSLLSNKKMVGKAGSEDLYVLENQKNSLHDLLYKDYQVGRQEDLLSFEEFLSKKPYFLWQDGIGDWRVFFSADYQPLAECAKPVIYLYPKSDTNVSVQVGADITISDPKYPANGWKVIAHPNGVLDYQETSYESLFWEGRGDGQYPNIQNTGFLARQENLENTIYDHLASLGLNQKESDDFMIFWKDRLPKNDYVRLTWLGTKEMDQLAPLTVSPSPDTSIRIFLEFQGYDQPVNLTPQTLSAPKRNGFTLIEWGGLLIK